jgi:hypothetical protein
MKFSLRSWLSNFCLTTASMRGAKTKRINSLGGRIFDKDEEIFRENLMKTLINAAFHRLYN